VPVLTPHEAGEKSSHIPSFHPVVSQYTPTESRPKAFTIPPGKHTTDILKDFGYSEDQTRVLQAAGALGGGGSSSKSKL